MDGAAVEAGVGVPKRTPDGGAAADVAVFAPPNRLPGCVACVVAFVCPNKLVAVDDPDALVFPKRPALGAVD